jgi:hypothetical protein
MARITGRLSRERDRMAISSDSEKDPWNQQSTLLQSFQSDQDHGLNDLTAPTMGRSRLLGHSCDYGEIE